jgi:CxxC-x17-CxxC domain-containing protein
MLVFISWSGKRSKFVAEALETWLAQVIQAAEPWISQDIDKGLRWGAEIADRLESSKVGIICLTRSNLDARWIHFEAGALSKTKDAYVCTLLLDIKPSEVEQPLAQFQHTTTNKEDILQLLSTINRAVQHSGEKALAEPILKSIFDIYWPRLEEVLQKANTLQESEGSLPRSTDEMLEEMLELLRNQERRQNQSIVEGFRSSPSTVERSGFGGDRPPRQMVEGDWICSACGASITELPFQPGRLDNLLCRDCHHAARQQRPSFGGSRYD